jgi:(4-(4-[2-(gamma-L-glutamylamino)ethyl]phenoxymethyl)furan-2-yl)methanamine synthase
MSRETIGLDIGGANLKAATATEALSVPFELWRRPEGLADNLSSIHARWPNIHNVAVTMTAELCDCFLTKRDGVRHILAAVEQAFPNCAIRVWSTAGRFVSIAAANEQHMSVAAANWHALATRAVREFCRGPSLLLDTGSTTTDIIPILDGYPIPLGKTDSERLRTGELVYTGVRRTPVCAVLNAGVAAEWFATTHDVYVALGLLPPEPDNRCTADGRPMTVQRAHARLARMLGGDDDVTPSEDVTGLAQVVFARQRQIIGDGIRQVLTRLPDRPRAVAFSGVGEFLARAAWDAVISGGDAEPVAVHSLSASLGPTMSEAACAHAVAVLASETESWE